VTLPEVVAIVLNWCGEDDTAACVQSLAASPYGRLTILVVDNGSPDGSGDRLHARFPQIAYLQTGANFGYTGGNNAGIQWAISRSAEYVLIINNDAVVDPLCIATLVEVAESRADVSVLAPKILYFDPPERIWYGGGAFSRMRAIGLPWRWGAADDPQSDSGTRPITFVTGCCFLARTDVLRRAGGFDESFFAYVEDAELSLRLVRTGHTLLYVPSARAYHRVAYAPTVPTPFHIRLRDRNRRRLVARHYGFSDRLRFAAWFYPTRLAHTLRYVLAGNIDCVRAQLDGTFGVLDGRPGKSGKNQADLSTD
jgi:GT2 family glycosyltransferase